MVSLKGLRAGREQLAEAAPPASPPPASPAELLLCAELWVEMAAKAANEGMRDLEYVQAAAAVSHAYSKLAGERMRLTLTEPFLEACRRDAAEQAQAAEAAAVAKAIADAEALGAGEAAAP